MKAPSSGGGTARVLQERVEAIAPGPQAPEPRAWR